MRQVDGLFETESISLDGLRLLGFDGGIGVSDE
jgi:hypothetical protein